MLEKTLLSGKMTQMFIGVYRSWLQFTKSLLPEKTVNYFYKYPVPTMYQTLFNARKPSLFALPFWQNILTDLKINLDLVSQALHK